MLIYWRQACTSFLNTQNSSWVVRLSHSPQSSLLEVLGGLYQTQGVWILTLLVRDACMWCGVLTHGARWSKAVRCPMTGTRKLVLLLTFLPSPLGSWTIWLKKEVGPIDYWWRFILARTQAIKVLEAVVVSSNDEEENVSVLLCWLLLYTWPYVLILILVLLSFILNDLSDKGGRVIITLLGHKVTLLHLIYHFPPLL